MQAARATEAFKCVQFQRVEYSACASVKSEKSAALLKIFGSEGITDQSDRNKVATGKGFRSRGHLGSVPIF